RLAGAAVGFLSIVLAIWAWRTESRRWVRRLAYGVLGAVIFQGVLGGLRVVLLKLNLAIVHACFAQAFFCLAALVAVVTSRWWLCPLPRYAGGGQGWGSERRHEPQPSEPPPQPSPGVPGEGEIQCSLARLIRLGVIAVLLIYSQLILGA